MRDILITLIVFVGCLYTFKRPYIGILLWSWLSYMNPHRLAFGFAYSAPFAQITAIILLISMLLSKEEKKFPVNTITVIWILFLIWMGLTTIFAFYPENAFVQYIKVIKIQIITFVTLMLINDLDKLKKLIWVICLSVGYYSVKGGVFTLATGGQHRVWGPSGSFIEDNNSLAVAVLMVIFLMIFLYQTTRKLWIRYGLVFAIITSLFTVLGSQSRGALIAITTVGAFYWLKSGTKIYSGIILFLLIFSLLAFMPETWYQRMNTIQNYEQDGSAMGRLNAWEYAIHASNDNFLGMGFESWTPLTFSMYAPRPDAHAAHSIYFGVLGDHGWMGLFLFMLIFYLSWKRIKKIIKETQENASLKEINLLAKMLQVSLLAYFSGGAFLSLSYFDLPWHLVSFIIILSIQLDNYKSVEKAKIVDGRKY